MRSVGIAGVLLASGAAAQVRYDGDMEVRVATRSEQELASAMSLVGQMLSCEPRAGVFDARVNAAQAQALAKARIPYTVLIADLQRALDDLRAQEAAARATDDQSWFVTYRDLSEIEARLAYYAATYPAIATLSDVSTSVQGHPIKMLRLTGPGSTQNRPAFLIQANQHAREWVTPMCAMFIIDRLCEGYLVDPRLHHIVDNVDLYIIPSVNPDGYVYSRTTEALWRKNRRDNPGTTCDGVDLNRNWGYQWGLDGVGSSPDPCVETYRGAAAWSEPEIAGIKSLADSLAAQGRLRVWWDVHSDFQMYASPWQYTATGTPPDLALMNQLAQRVQSSILSVRGLSYQIGQNGIIMYLINGGNSDYAYAVDGSLAWTFEMGGGSFQPPVNQILPLAQECFAGFLPMAEYLAPRPCYANCDQSTINPILNVNDFACFLNLFAAGGWQANCDGSTVAPILNVNDFACFLNAFAVGCS
jgi:hypothetical protein